MRLPRMTTRRWMVLVAVFGVTIWGALLAARNYAYWQLGVFHRNQIKCVLHGRPGMDGKYVYTPLAVDQQGKPTSKRQQAIDRWHESMPQKYWAASSRPWLPVPPDPPEPK